jgi:hypothetical protein
LSRPQDHDLPFSTWSLHKLADFLVAEGVVEDISHQGLREVLREVLREQGVSFQRLKTWKQSRDPAYHAKAARVLHLYALMDGTEDAEPGDPDVVLCIDEFGPLNLQPTPVGSGPLAAAANRSRADDDGRPTSVPTACGTCWPPTTSTAIGSMGTSTGQRPTTSSWPTPRPTYFTLDGTDHASHEEQGRMIRRYLAWRNRRAPALLRVGGFIRV